MQTTRTLPIIRDKRALRGYLSIFSTLDGFSLEGNRKTVRFGILRHPWNDKSIVPLFKFKQLARHFTYVRARLLNVRQLQVANFTTFFFFFLYPDTRLPVWPFSKVHDICRQAVQGYFYHKQSVATFEYVPALIWWSLKAKLPTKDSTLVIGIRFC